MSYGSRRDVLSSVVTTIAFAAASSWADLAALGQYTPQPMPSPNAPNPNFPVGLDGSRGVARPNGPPLNTLNQEQMVASVRQLYELALELKKEVETTNLAAVLPTNFIKRAEQIEKLAKQIKQKAKG